jgi:hypothetical protein
MGRFLLGAVVGVVGLCLGTVGSGCSIGGETTTVTAGGTASPQTTSADELAKMEVAVNQWNVAYEANGAAGAKRCEDRAQAGVETYEACRARQISVVDEANTKLAKTLVTLSPVVDPGCGKALESAAHEIARGNSFANPGHAVSVCRGTVAG